MAFSSSSSPFSTPDPALQNLLTGVWGSRPSKVPLLVLYFAASWCDDCQHSHDQVRDVFQSQFINNDNKTTTTNGDQDQQQQLFDLVYVSSDTSEEELQSNLEDGWIHVPFDNVEQRSNIKRHFGVCAKKEMEDLGITPENRNDGIPTLVVIDKQRDTVLTTKGMDDILVDGNDDNGNDNDNGTDAKTKKDPLAKWRQLLSESNLED